MQACTRGWGAGLTLLLVTLLAACGQDLEEGGDLKVYRHSTPGVATTLEPLQASSAYSMVVVGNVYDSLYRFRYLAEPYELAPMLASDLPDISDDGLVYTIPLRPDARFIDDEAFHEGQGRGVVASDVVYSMKRHFHPDQISRAREFWEGRIEGMQEWIDAGADYDAPVTGLQALDDHTVQITLSAPFPDLLNTLTSPMSAIVPREAVEYHGEGLARHPVGSGPYRLVSFDTSRAVLEANRDFRQVPLDLAREGYDGAIHGDLGLEALDGRVPPFVDRIEIDFIEEETAQWASFTSGREIQYTKVPQNMMSEVLDPQDPQKLKAGYAERYFMRSGPELGISLMFFNMADPAIGYHEDPQRDAMNHELRCAIRDGFPWQEFNDRFYSGLGEYFPGVLLPRFAEYDPQGDMTIMSGNLEEAQQRLQAAGWQAENLPVLEYASASGTLNQEQFEHMRGYLTKLGFPASKVTYRRFANFGDYLEAIYNRELMFTPINFGTQPDAFNTMQMFYGPNAGAGFNISNYGNARFDALYEQARVLWPGEERTALLREMDRILIDDCVGLFSLSRRSVELWHRKVIGYPDVNVNQATWLRFVDIMDEGAGD